MQPSLTGPYCNHCSNDGGCEIAFGNSETSRSHCFGALSSNIPLPLSGYCRSALCTSMIPNNSFYGMIKPSLGSLNQGSTTGQPSSESSENQVDFSLSFHSFTNSTNVSASVSTLREQTTIFSISNITQCTLSITKCPITNALPVFIRESEWCVNILPPKLTPTGDGGTITSDGGTITGDGGTTLTGDGDISHCTVNSSQLKFNSYNYWKGFEDVIRGVFLGTGKFTYVGLTCAIDSYQPPYSVKGYIECAVLFTPDNTLTSDPMQVFYSKGSLITIELFVGTCFDRYLYNALMQTLPMPDQQGGEALCRFRNTLLPCASTLGFYIALLVGPNIVVLLYLGLYCYLFYQFNSPLHHADRKRPVKIYKGGIGQRSQLGLVNVNVKGVKAMSGIKADGINSIDNNVDGVPPGNGLHQSGMHGHGMMNSVHFGMVGKMRSGHFPTNCQLLTFNDVSLKLQSRDHPFAKKTTMSILQSVNGQIRNEVMGK